MRWSFSTASRIEYQVKNTSRKIRPTIGTLSGLVMMSWKFGSRPPRKKNSVRKTEQPVADRLRGEDLALPDHEDERQHHQEEIQPRVGENS